MPRHDKPIGTEMVVIPACELPGDQILPQEASRLFREISGAGGMIARVPKPQPEVTKAVPDVFYLTLPTVVALREVASVIKSWLRDRPRAVQIVEVRDGKVLHEYRVTGAVSDDTLHEILSHAVQPER